jgi:hypothetical protein
MYTLLIVSVQLIFAWFFPQIEGYSGWIIFAVFLGRIGVHHPVSEIEESLDRKRQVLGWICLIIFIICLSPKPFKLHAVPQDQKMKTEEPAKPAETT